MHNWLGSLKLHGKVVRILVMDFWKATTESIMQYFCLKLSSTGVPDFLNSWVTNNLCDCRQRVKIGFTISKWSHLKTGVPQGTLLGPVAFLLHVNDLQTVCPSIRYVDDSSIWEVCNRSGSNSQIRTAGNQATT